MFCHSRRLVFDQSSPVHPVSESRGVPERDEVVVEEVAGKNYFFLILDNISYVLHLWFCDILHCKTFIFFDIIHLRPLTLCDILHVVTFYILRHFLFYNIKSFVSFISFLNFIFCDFSHFVTFPYLQQFTFCVIFHLVTFNPL